MKEFFKKMILFARTLPTRVKIYFANKKIMKKTLKSLLKFGREYYKYGFPVSFAIEEILVKTRRTSYHQDGTEASDDRTILAMEPFEMARWNKEFMRLISENYNLEENELPDFIVYYLNLYYNVSTLYKQSLSAIQNMVESDYPEIDWDKFPIETIKDEAQNKLVDLEKIVFKELSQLKTANPEEDTGSYW